MQGSDLCKLYVLWGALEKGDEAGTCVVVLAPMVGIVTRETKVKHCYILFVCLFIYGAKDLTQDLTYVLMLNKLSASYYSGLSPVPQLQEQTQPTQRLPRSCHLIFVVCDA